MRRGPGRTLRPPLGARSHWLLGGRTALPLARGWLGRSRLESSRNPERRAADDGPASGLQETLGPGAHSPPLPRSLAALKRPFSGPGRHTRVFAQAQPVRPSRPRQPLRPQAPPPDAGELPAAPPPPAAAVEAEGDDVSEQGDGHWAPF